ncbi:Acetyl esterase/lipase [Arcanobacterium phocae]|uniref:Acetyl esterase/lipase n=1 Tax=Arcanobacterium phocae TaxID=131112 RepID=A0A1H2LI67_9ACTO|nr:alpha/beta hydrolase fold domain-containing protein [Arcanobacterium phocae]SDU80609.1 Acetyl esterase/lipase [Arcanobacterium phocae]
MHFFIRHDVLSHLDYLPEQTTWDLPTLRSARPLPTVTPPPTVANANGVEVRIFTPRSLPANTPPRLVMVSIHGGGYVAGKAQQDDTKNAQLCELLQAIVIAPEYRLAPEYPLPAAWDDCIAVTQWAIKKYDAPIFVHGDSAGGGLAYAVGCTLRSLVAGVILFEPCIDPSMSYESFITHEHGPFWTRRAATHAWAATVGDGVAALPFPKPSAPYPPTVVVVNPVDPLRDEGIALATGLVDVGTEAELHFYPGTVHATLSAPESHIWPEIQTLIKRFVDSQITPYSQPKDLV